MKTLIFWAWAFGFAIAKHLWENNPDIKFSLYDKDQNIINKLQENRQHPYFFEWFKLSKNIVIESNIDEKISDFDLIFLIIPAQFVKSAIEELKDKLKKWVILINCAKWIDNSSCQTISQIISIVMKRRKYTYWVLSWWMIAQEVVENKTVGADLWVSNLKNWKIVKNLLESKTFYINLSKKIIEIELFGSLKNVLAIIIWYHIGKWEQYSTIWYHAVNYFNECKNIIKIFVSKFKFLKRVPKINFGMYSLWWDIIATCFGHSRNREFGELIGKWMPVKDAINFMEENKRHVEGYPTVKALYEKIKWEKWFELTKKLYELLYK